MFKANTEAEFNKVCSEMTVRISARRSADAAQIYSDVSEIRSKSISIFIIRNRESTKGSQTHIYTNSNEIGNRLTDVPRTNRDSYFMNDTNSNPLGQYFSPGTSIYIFIHFLPILEWNI